MTNILCLPDIIQFSYAFDFVFHFRSLSISHCASRFTQKAEMLSGLDVNLQ